MLEAICAVDQAMASRGKVVRLTHLVVVWGMLDRHLRLLELLANLGRPLCASARDVGNAATHRLHSLLTRASTYRPHMLVRSWFVDSSSAVGEEVHSLCLPTAAT